MKVIGLIGKKQSGKDTLAKLLIEIGKEEGVNVVTLAFADPLKEELYQKLLKPLNIPIEALYDDRKKHFRLVLQGYGTDIIRELVDEDYWVNKVREEVLKYKDTNTLVILTDVRLPNEVSLVGEFDGYSIRVIRPDQEENDLHISECALDSFKTNLSIDNPSNMLEYYTRAKRLYKLL